MCVCVCEREGGRGREQIQQDSSTKPFLKLLHTYCKEEKGRNRHACTHTTMFTDTHCTLQTSNVCTANNYVSTLSRMISSETPCEHGYMYIHKSYIYMYNVHADMQKHVLMILSQMYMYTQITTTHVTSVWNEKSEFFTYMYVQVGVSE